ncbi:MAG TPA: HD domain-containing protein [Flavobacteriales bacterium]|nr:HD domain-containing protein [Flavobacteriales bacterium]
MNLRLSENNNYAKYLVPAILSTISKVADENGIPIYLVGGYVRDIILDRPNKDIDFVVLGSGIAFAEKLAQALNTHASYFKNFGTAQIKFDDLELEFVGARKESYSRDSRKPIVEEGTLADDQNRRDFTINAMAICINKKNYGDLIDPFGGINDLKTGTIRTPLDPDITYSDDPLRMMRAIRFASQLNFNIEEKSLEAITRNRERLKIISTERIMDEFNKIMLCKKPSRGIDMLFKAGLLELFFPEMVKLHGVETRNGHAHKDNFYHTIQVLDNICANTNNLWLRWAALLHDIAKPPTKRYSEGEGWTFHGHEDLGAKMVPNIFKRLKLPLDAKMKYVQNLVRLHLRPIALTNGSVTDSAVRRLIVEAGDDLEDLMVLCEADITTKNKAKEERYLQKFKAVRAFIKEVEERDQLKNWQPPITGQIIMDTFGIGQSREVGIIKNQVRESILDGKIKNDYAEAYELMLKLGDEIGLKKK